MPFTRLVAREILCNSSGLGLYFPAQYTEYHLADWIVWLYPCSVAHPLDPSIWEGNQMPSKNSAKKPDNENESVELDIEVSGSKTSAEDEDQMAQQLISELTDAGVDSAEFTKSTTFTKRFIRNRITTIGSITITVFPALLPGLVSLIQTWASRGQGRRVKFKGMGREFEGSPEEFQKLIVELEKRHPRLAGDSTIEAPPPPKKKKDR